VFAGWDSLCAVSQTLRQKHVFGLRAHLVCTSDEDNTDCTTWPIASDPSGAHFTSPLS